MPLTSGTIEITTANRAALTAAAALSLAAAGLAGAPAASAGTVDPYMTCSAANAATMGARVPVTADVMSADRTGATLRLDPGALPFRPAVAITDTLTVAYRLALSGGATGTVTVSTPPAPVEVAAQAPIDAPAQEARLDAAAADRSTVSVEIRGLTVTLGGGMSFACTVSGSSGTLASYQVRTTTLAATSSGVTAGGEVGVYGDAWPAGATPQACLAPGADAACDTAALAGRALTVSPDGRLSGTVTVAAATPPGEYVLRVTSGATAATVPLTVREAPRVASVVLTPSAGPLGTTTRVTGSGFRPATPVLVSAVDASGRRLPGAEAATGADGTLDVPFTVTDPATTGVEVMELSAPGAIVRSAFALTPGPAPGTRGEQTVGATLGAGGLTMSQEGSGISFGSATLDGTAQRLSAALREVTVIDARGGGLGWSVTATMTDLVTADGAGVIPAGSIAWTPACSASPESPSTAVPGAPGALGATASTLCSQQAAGNGALTGGRFTAGAALTLTTPEFPAAGAYTGTLTLTLS